MGPAVPRPAEILEAGDPQGKTTRKMLKDMKIRRLAFMRGDAPWPIYHKSDREGNVQTWLFGGGRVIVLLDPPPTAGVRRR